MSEPQPNPMPPRNPRPRADTLYTPAAGDRERTAEEVNAYRLQQGARK